VVEQSAIKAGDGGFNVNVKGDTTLTGGAITSTQAAVDGGKNSFSTGGKVVKRELEPEETRNLKPGDNGQITIATNGINNTLDTAAANALQNDPGKETVYLVYFPEASNALAELLVAGYQKFMENDFWGLSNATTQMGSYALQYGNDSLTLDGHSRGAMTIGNALESLINAGWSDVLGGTNINLFGPAYSAQDTANLLFGLGGSATGVTLQNHLADPVGTIIGGNPATGGTIPAGSSWLQEAIKAITGQPVTSHNSYGDGKPDSGKLWEDMQNNKPVSVIIPAQIPER
jgi:filamentous hemagglutinin